jgi:hypothetical protein
MDASRTQPTEVVTGAAGPASDHDQAGVPVHRGWAPLGGRHRWMEPFALVLLAEGRAHGYAVISELEEMGITGGAVDVGQVYRTLRDLEDPAVTSLVIEPADRNDGLRVYGGGYTALTSGRP